MGMLVGSRVTAKLLGDTIGGSVEGWLRQLESTAWGTGVVRAWGECGDRVGTMCGDGIGTAWGHTCVSVHICTRMCEHVSVHEYMHECVHIWVCAYSVCTAPCTCICVNGHSTCEHTRLCEHGHE